MDASDKSNPKTIATIDVNLHIPAVDKKTWLEESIDDHLNCVLCGGHLEFAHKTDFISGVVTEDAHCPTCGVRNRQSAHSLQ